MDNDNLLKYLNPAHFRPVRIMMGYAGELMFYYRMEEGSKEFVGLEILKHWSPYTPAMEPGKDYWLIA